MIQDTEGRDEFVRDIRALIDSTEKNFRDLRDHYLAMDASAKAMDADLEMARMYGDCGEFFTSIGIPVGDERREKLGEIFCEGWRRAKKDERKQ